jgi:hypothetical protein
VDSVDTESSESTTTSSDTEKTLKSLTGHVYVGFNSLRAEILQEIFDRHSEGGLLTLCIDELYDRSAGIEHPGFNYIETIVGVAPAAWKLETFGGIEYHSASFETNVVAAEIEVSVGPVVRISHSPADRAVHFHLPRPLKRFTFSHSPWLR